MHSRVEASLAELLHFTLPVLTYLACLKVNAGLYLVPIKARKNVLVALTVETASGGLCGIS